MKDKCLVAGSQHFAQEVFGRLFLDRQRFILAHGGIDGEAQRQGRVCCLREVPDTLKHTVFGQLEIRPLQVSNRMALPVSHHRVNVDYVGQRPERRPGSRTLALAVCPGCSSRNASVQGD